MKPKIISSKKVRVALWTAQVLLALVFLFAGSMKLILPLDQMKGPIAFPGLFIHFIGVCEVLGAVGLIVPGLARIRTELTPIAAFGLLIIMIGAVTTTVATMSIGAAVVPFVVGVLCAFIAYARWPYRSRDAVVIVGGVLHGNPIRDY